VAVRRGVGTVVLDVRRGDGPPVARGYTFPALVATDRTIADHQEMTAAEVRAIVRAQQALRGDPNMATRAATDLFPATETGLIAELIERDLPYYDPKIEPETVEAMNGFAERAGLLSSPVPYENVVATQFREFWRAES